MLPVAILIMLTILTMRIVLPLSIWPCRSCCQCWPCRLCFHRLCGWCWPLGLFCHCPGLLFGPNWPWGHCCFCPCLQCNVDHVDNGDHVAFTYVVFHADHGNVFLLTMLLTFQSGHWRQNDTARYIVTDFQENFTILKIACRELIEMTNWLQQMPFPTSPLLIMLYFWSVC